MRALTVRQPWAWAILHGGKDVENRIRNLAGSYRGPVAIHAGKTIDETGAVEVPRLINEQRGGDGFGLYLGRDHFGAFVGVVDLVSVHHDSDHGPHRCSTWAEPDDWHLVLANPRPLEVPIPARGMLGLWTPPASALEQLQAAA